MNLPANIVELTEQEYLEGEAEAEIRHEYVAGQVFAMAGASKVHATLSLNVASMLHSSLRGGPCRTYIADMKVKVSQSSAYYYPDVVATCSATDNAADAPRDHLTEPLLIVEVLSPNTEQIDRREKMLAYRLLPSLVEYALIDQEKHWIELYRRVDGGWQHLLFGPDTTVEFVSVGVSIAIADIYAGVEAA
jgi:Uma2 family endonuclease